MTVEDRTGSRTIGQLVADASSDVQGLVRSEIALAKAEVQQGVKKLGKGAGLLGAAGFVALIGLIFLFHTMAQTIAIWLPQWASYLIVTGFLFLVAAVLALVGRSALRSAKPVPERAIAQAQETIVQAQQTLSEIIPQVPAPAPGPGAAAKPAPLPTPTAAQSAAAQSAAGQRATPGR